MPSSAASSGASSGSSVSSATRYGRLSPTTTACETQRVSRSALSMFVGRDVLAAGGDDQVLLAARDVQVAVVVDGAEVAGAQPAVRRAPPRSPPGRGGSRRTRAGPRSRISPSSAIATSVPGSGRPDAAEAHVARAVDACRRRRSRSARSPRGSSTPQASKNSSTSGPIGAAPHIANTSRSPNSARTVDEHEPVGERVAQPQTRAGGRRRAPRRGSARPRASAQSEHARLATALLGDLVEDARCGSSRRSAAPPGSASGATRASSSTIRLRVAAPEHERAARAERRQLGHPRERVGEREEQVDGQRPRSSSSRSRVHLDRGQQLGVGDHAALGRPGRPGRVDDRGDVVGPRRPARSVDVAVELAPRARSSASVIAPGASPASTIACSSGGSVRGARRAWRAAPASSQKTTADARRGRGCRRTRPASSCGRSARRPRRRSSAPRSASVHSGRVPARMATRSPGSMPSAARPAAISRPARASSA